MIGVVRDDAFAMVGRGELTDVAQARIERLLPTVGALAGGGGIAGR